MHADATQSCRDPPVLPGRSEHGRAGSEQAELQAHDDAVPGRTTGSAMTRNRPAARVVSTIPATVSNTARPPPTASGTTSHDGGAACPQPNQTNAKNPSTATVTPRSRCEHGITITTRAAESGMVLNRTASSSVC